jgi:hypothetical protein
MGVAIHSKLVSKPAEVHEWPTFALFYPRLTVKVAFSRSMMTDLDSLLIP